LHEFGEREKDEWAAEKTKGVIILRKIWRKSGDY
jgi:hypothetical protein